MKSIKRLCKIKELQRETILNIIKIPEGAKEYAKVVFEEIIPENYPKRMRNIKT